MGEIDDLYKDREETLDQNLLEEFNNKKEKRDSLVKNYREDLKSLIKDYNTKYSKQLSREKRDLRKKKEKKEKKEQFKRLKVKHFSFEPTPWEKFKAWWNITLFRISRFFWMLFRILVPDKILYYYYIVKKTTIKSFIGIKEFCWDLLSSAGMFFKKEGTIIGKFLKKIGLSIKKVVKKILSKIFFWKKKEAGKEGEKKEGDKSPEDKKDGVAEKSPVEEQKKGEGEKPV